MTTIEPEDLARALVELQEWASTVPLSTSAGDLSERLREHLEADGGGLVWGRGLT